MSLALYRQVRDEEAERLRPVLGGRLDNAVAILDDLMPAAGEEAGFTEFLTYIAYDYLN
jgi:hypothetical protein